jgi:hypothetical protein
MLGGVLGGVIPPEANTDRTRVIAEAAVSRSSAIEMRSAHDHQNQQRPSLPWLT